MDARKFLELLWGEHPPGAVNLWTMPDKRSRWYRDLAGVNEDLRGLEHMDVYVAAVTADQGLIPMAPTIRVTGRTAQALAGPWVEIELAHPKHICNQHNPPDAGAALDALMTMPAKPTIVVSSGRSIQCWWLFTEPWSLTETPSPTKETKRQQAERMLSWWDQQAREKLAAHGWDTARRPSLGSVVRLPGTMNNRVQDERLPVVVIRQSHVRLDAERTMALVPIPNPAPSPAHPEQETLEEPRCAETPAPTAMSEGCW